jgi:hypothetical protein
LQVRFGRFGGSLGGLAALDGATPPALAALSPARCALDRDVGRMLRSLAP